MNYLHTLIIPTLAIIVWYFVKFNHIDYIKQKEARRIKSLEAKENLESH